MEISNMILDYSSWSKLYESTDVVNYLEIKFKADTGPVNDPAVTLEPIQIILDKFKNTVKVEKMKCIKDTVEIELSLVESDFDLYSDLGISSNISFSINSSALTKNREFFTIVSAFNDIIGKTYSQISNKTKTNSFGEKIEIITLKVQSSILKNNPIEFLKSISINSFKNKPIIKSQFGNFPPSDFKITELSDEHLISALTAKDKTERTRALNIVINCLEYSVNHSQECKENYLINIIRGFTTNIIICNLDDYRKFIIEEFLSIKNALESNKDLNERKQIIEKLLLFQIMLDKYLSPGFVESKLSSEYLLKTMELQNEHNITSHEFDDALESYRTKKRTPNEKLSELADETIKNKLRN